MATTAARPPSNSSRALQTAWARAALAAERRLEAERAQLPLWLPVALGAGATLWFALPTRADWTAAILVALALATAAAAAMRGGRAAAWLTALALAVALGLAGTWWRAERTRAPVLARPAMTTLEGRVDAVQPLPARELVRVRLTNLTWPNGAPDEAPARVRVNIATADVPAGLTRGARLRLKARLMPPPAPGLPGGYDFARVAWFDRLGATGRAVAPVTVVTPGDPTPRLRERLNAHILARLPGSEGGVAAALATGDVGAIADEDAEAMRRAGLAHLLSVSGLHITAAVGFAMLLLGRLLALWPPLARTGRVPLLAAAGGALVAIGYTWLTGAEVPTIRSCVAALLVLGALALGREAVTLRLVAAGALVVLLLWPEAVAGASFQLSFAAVTVIVAFHEHAAVRAFFAPREEAWWWRAARGLVGLLATGLLVEVALMPIAAWHFHKAGLYGALANLLAIPLTTFVVMPAEALALLLDTMGLGTPAWWVAGQALTLLLVLARWVASAPGAVAAVPVMPNAAFALMVAGGLWLALWRTRWRIWGLLPMALGAAWTIATPAPDLLVTGDGRHLAVRTDGGIAMLRDRAGDYVQDALSAGAGVDGAPALLSEIRQARCNQDLCWIERREGARAWHVLATRSAHLVPARELSALCRRADVVVSERRVPRRCRARWLTLDRATLARTGGVAIRFADANVHTVRVARDEHPWRETATTGEDRDHNRRPQRTWDR